MKKILFAFAFFIAGSAVQAQCAMCRAVIENGGDTAAAQGLNNGITYLMAFPYLVVGAIIYIIYRSTTKNSSTVESET